MSIISKKKNPSVTSNSTFSIDANWFGILVSIKLKVVGSLNLEDVTILPEKFLVKMVVGKTFRREIQDQKCFQID